MIKRSNCRTKGINVHGVCGRKSSRWWMKVSDADTQSARRLVFCDAAVGLLQLGVDRATTVNSWVVTEGAERHCSACVWHTTSWPCFAISDPIALAAVQVASAQWRMHAIHNKRSPSHLSEAVQTATIATTCCGLRSSTTIRTMSRRGHIPSSASGLSHMQVLLPGTAFQSTFVPSPHLLYTRHLKTFLFTRAFNTMNLNKCNVCCTLYVSKHEKDIWWWWWWWWWWW